MNVMNPTEIRTRLSDFSHFDTVLDNYIVIFNIFLIASTIYSERHESQEPLYTNEKIIINRKKK